MFDDGVRWKCTTSRMYKFRDNSKKDSLTVDTSFSSSISTPSPVYEAGPSIGANYHTHLFDPTRDYLSSKSERREMKRKLNIKEIFNIGQKKRKIDVTRKEKVKVVKEKKPKAVKKVKIETGRDVKVSIEKLKEVKVKKEVPGKCYFVCAEASVIQDGILRWGTQSCYQKHYSYNKTYLGDRQCLSTSWDVMR